MVFDHIPAGLLRLPAWERYSWLKHGFSTRVGGVSTVYGGHDLNLGFTRDDTPEAVRENRRRAAEAIAGQPEPPLVAVRQVHGTTVLLVEAASNNWRDSEGRALQDADGLMTAATGILLGVQAADCVPVLVADVRLRVVAAFHAGWRGTVAGMVQKGVAQVQSHFGSQAEDLIGAVGPAIGACCYTVGDEVREQFHAAFSYAPELFDQRDTGLHLDLAEANRRQLLAAGLPPESITVVGECTACTRLADGSRKYFSHRAEQGFTGRAMGIIGIAKP